MKLEEISDDWLIGLVYEKNQDAIDYLFERYDKIIYAIIANLQKKNGDYFEFDDLYQEGFYALLNCIEKYDGDCGRFYYFAKVVIERKIRDKMNQIVQDRKVLSLDKEMYEDGNVEYVDLVCEDDDGYLENDLYDKLVSRLDFKSISIVDFKMMGYTYQEIAKILNTSRQWIYRRVNKIKNILKDIIEKID